MSMTSNSCKMFFQKLKNDKKLKEEQMYQKSNLKKKPKNIADNLVSKDRNLTIDEHTRLDNQEKV